MRALAFLAALSVAAASTAQASVRPEGIESLAAALRAGASTTGGASGSRLFLEKDGAGHRDSVHLYAGFANDPVNLRDPTGEAIPLVVAGVVALASLLAIEGVANAPDFDDATLPAPGAGEIIAKTAILAASGGVGYGVASGLGLGGFRLAVGATAFGGASVGAGFQATDDVVAGQFSGVGAYVASTARGFYLGGLFGGGFYGLGRGLGGVSSRARQAMSFDDIVERGWASGVRSYAQEATTVAPTRVGGSGLGRLRSIGPSTWESSGGLVYGPDKVFGNRVRHVLAHTVPDATKPMHSVFNVRRSEVLGLVDEAWAMRRAGVPGDPGAFVVPMGRVIGTSGETAIRVVVRPGTNQFLTAYPVVP